MQRKPENWKPSGYLLYGAVMQRPDTHGRSVGIRRIPPRRRSTVYLTYLGQRLLLFYYISRPLARLSPLALGAEERGSTTYSIQQTQPHIQSRVVPELVMACRGCSRLACALHNGREQIHSVS